MILMNVQCENCYTDDEMETFLQDIDAKPQRRYFNQSDKTIEQKDFQDLIEYIEDCNEIAPIDINHDGRLDIFCQHTNNYGMKDFKVIYNNIQIDNFFLESMMVYKIQNRSKSYISDIISS
jgi:hypothetical protein